MKKVCCRFTIIGKLLATFFWHTCRKFHFYKGSDRFSTNTSLSFNASCHELVSWKNTTIPTVLSVVLAILSTLFILSILLHQSLISTVILLLFYYLNWSLNSFLFMSTIALYLHRNMWRFNLSHLLLFYWLSTLKCICREKMCHIKNIWVDI